MEKSIDNNNNNKVNRNHKSNIRNSYDDAHNDYKSSDDNDNNDNNNNNNNNTRANKPTFKEWLTDRNITLMIVVVLVAYSVDRFSKSMHNELVTPAFNNVAKKMGYDKAASPNKCHTVLFHVLELTASIVLLYLLSTLVFKHESKPKPKPEPKSRHLCDKCKANF